MTYSRLAILHKGVLPCRHSLVQRGHPLLHRQRRPQVPWRVPEDQPGFISWARLILTYLLTYWWITYVLTYLPPGLLTYLLMHGFKLLTYLLTSWITHSLFPINNMQTCIHAYMHTCVHALHASNTLHTLHSLNTLHVLHYIT